MRKTDRYSTYTEQLLQVSNASNPCKQTIQAYAKAMLQTKSQDSTTQTDSFRTTGDQLVWLCRSYMTEMSKSF